MSYLQNPDFNTREEVMAANRSRVCQAMYEIGIAFRRDHTDIVRRLLVDQRLGDQRRTGTCLCSLRCTAEQGLSHELALLPAMSRP